MKRSEMVKKLMETMGCYDNWEKQCGYMLEICEDEGMLPPESEKYNPWLHDTENFWDSEE